MFSRRYFRPKFLFFVGCIIIPAILAFRIIVSFFQALDYLLFPGFWRTEVKQPFFILSNPRSGSTFLHRMLEKDEQFTYFSLWQSLFNSITLYKIIRLTSKLDQNMGCPLAQLIEKIDNYFFKGWDGLHKAGLRYSEEDEFLFVSSFLAPGLILFFPYLHEIPDIYCIDNLPEKARKKIVRNFRRSVQRHVYASGNHIFLAKNAVAGGRLGIYHDAFPDMRAIYIHSDILKSIGSSLSVFSKPWSFHSPNLYQKKYESFSIVEMVCTNHQGIINYQSQFDKENIFDIEYADLVSNPEATVRSIYQHFDMPISKKYEAALIKDCIAAKSYQSSHSYSIEDYGFSNTEIIRYLQGKLSSQDILADT
jgi:hypothetical protein